jgi:hypothetical protein
VKTASAESDAAIGVVRRMITIGGRHYSHRLFAFVRAIGTTVGRQLMSVRLVLFLSKPFTDLLGKRLSGTGGRFFSIKFGPGVNDGLLALQSGGGTLAPVDLFNLLKAVACCSLLYS